MAAFVILKPLRRSSIVYIDGFNLYYGAVRGTPHKWLDLQRLFELLRPHDQRECVHYFTALVSGSGRVRQDTYIRALATSPLVDTVLGAFKNKRIKCGFSACQGPAGDRFFEMPEEKTTDVNIALHMLDDAYRDRCEQLILVSGDSDLVPAIKMIRHRFPTKRVIVYVPSRAPQRRFARELRSTAHGLKPLPQGLLQHAQFPVTLMGIDGTTINKPAGW